MTDRERFIAEGPAYMMKEIDRLRYEMARLKEAIAARPDWEKLWAEREDEIERLREALQRLIISGQKAHDIGFRKTDIWDAFGRDLEFARAELQEKGKGER